MLAIEPFDVRGAAQREIHLDAAGIPETVCLPHRLGHHKNIAE